MCCVPISSGISGRLTPRLLIPSSSFHKSISEKMDRSSLSVLPGQCDKVLALERNPPASLSVDQVPQCLVSLPCIIEALELNTSVIFLSLET